VGISRVEVEYVVTDLTAEQFGETVQQSFREGVAIVLGVSPSQVVILRFYNTVKKQSSSLVVNYQVVVPSDQADAVTETLQDTAAVSAAVETQLVANDAPVTSFAVEEDPSTTTVVVTGGDDETEEQSPIVVCENFYSDANCEHRVSYSCTNTNGLSCEGAAKPGWDTNCVDDFEGYDTCCTNIDGGSFQATCTNAEVTEVEYTVCAYTYTDQNCATQASSSCQITTVDCATMLSINLDGYQDICNLSNWGECCSDLSIGTGSFEVTCEKVDPNNPGTSASSTFSPIVALFIAAIVALARVF